jgi:hypothetical protein
MAANKYKKAVKTLKPNLATLIAILVRPAVSATGAAAQETDLLLGTHTVDRDYPARLGARLQLKPLFGRPVKRA